MSNNYECCQVPHENCEEVEEQIPVEVCTSVDLTRHSSAYLFLMNYLFISLHCFFTGSRSFQSLHMGG